MNKVTWLVLFIFTNSIMAISQTAPSADEAHGLKVGTAAPDFKANDLNGDQFELKKALENGPIVLIFYRGEWCPYCNKHLALIQDSLKSIQKLGASVVAVSSQKPEYLAAMKDNTGADFTLLYDETYHISEAFGVSYQPAKAEIFKYNTFAGAHLEDNYADSSQRLPIPATYVIGQDGQIVWRHFDPNYKKRSSVGDILNSLKTIQKTPY